MREQLYRSEFNKFINSKEGKNYYLGVIPQQKRQPIVARDMTLGKKRGSNGSVKTDL